MPDYGMNMALVGNRNRSTILNYINKKGSASRKEIAEATSLTAAAVTQISQGLIKEGVLVETGILEGSGAGRKQVGLCIDYNCRYVLSVNIEQAHTVIALCNMKGEVKDASAKVKAGVKANAKGDVEAIVKLETDTSLSPEAFLQRISDECRAILGNTKKNVLSKVTGVAVGIPGIVDQELGIAKHAYGIWEDEVKVCEYLEDTLGLPCYIFNNVNAFAQASSLYGIGRNYDNMLVIKWGPGVGGTILVDNRVYDGRHGKAAEIGHYIVRKNGNICNCGRRGCLETVVSYSALNRVVKFDEGGFAKAYTQADDKQKQTIDEAIDMFARSIVNTVTVLAPDRVILCGFMFREPQTRELLLARISEYDPSLSARRILYTELSECEEYIGPVAAYVQRILQ